MRAASTSRQTQAAQLRTNRQTKCRQKDTDGKTAIRHISAANNYPLRQHTFARIFSYTENKISGMQPLYSRRLRRRPLSHGSYLMMAHYKQPLTTIILPASVLLFRHHSAPKVHPLCSAAFRNPKMHPHQ